MPQSTTLTTPTSTPARRSLTFRDLDDIIRDIETLHAHGYDRAGNWGLTQVCRHLADWMRFPLDGFPKNPWPVRLILSAMKVTVGRKALRDILKNGSMPSGKPTLPQTVASPTADDDKAVAEIREIVSRFKRHNGPVHPSPLFGEMDLATATRLQLIHCAHHLSFLVPKS